MYQKLGKTLFGALAAATLFSSAASAETWRAWNIHNDGHPNTAAMDRLAELIGEATGGEVTLEVLEGEGGEIMAAAMGDAGILPLAWIDAGARSFYAQKPINTPADVEGLKIRVMNNDEAAAYQRELWAVQSEQARKDVEAAGIAVNEIENKAPFQDAMASVYEDYLSANPDMRKLVEIAQSTE